MLIINEIITLRARILHAVNKQLRISVGFQ